MSKYSFSQSYEYPITSNNYNFSIPNNNQISSLNTNNNINQYDTVSYEPISNNYEIITNNLEGKLNNFESNNNNIIYETNNENYNLNDNNYQISENNIFETNENNIINNNNYQINENNIYETNNENNNIINNNYQINENNIYETNENNIQIENNTYQINNNIDLGNNIYQNNIENNQINYEYQLNNDNNNNYQTITNNNSFSKLINEQFSNPTQIQEGQDIQISYDFQNYEQTGQINNNITENQTEITNQNNILNDLYNPSPGNNMIFEINTDIPKESNNNIENNNNINKNELLQENNKEEKKEEEKPPLIDTNKIYTIEQYSEILRTLFGKNKESENKELEEVLIKIVEKTTHTQRQQIRGYLYRNYSENLILILKKELNGNFRESILGSFLLPSEYDTYCLNSSFKNKNQKKESILSEIIGSRSITELQTIKRLYKSNYRKLLRKDIISETYGDYQKFLLSLLQCQRSNASMPNTNSCANDATYLYQSGEKKRSTDEDTFIRIFTTSSPIELTVINHFYKQQTGKGLLGAIETEFDFCKETKDLLNIIIRTLVDKEGFYAKIIKDAINEENDAQLIRIICSRHAVDLKEIKNVYKRDYKKELINDIKDKKNDNWGKIIYSLVDNAK